MFTIAGYDVRATLHEGSKSAVYRGQRIHDQQPIILKVMQAEYPSLDELGRYRLEYDILTRFDFEGVSRAYDLTQYQNGLVLILEDMGGTSLQEILQTRRLSLTEFLELGISLAEILGQIHAANVIHKDINPANILLNPASGQVRLIDFGNATVLSRENPSIRSPNVLEGTLPYLSPEQTGRMNRALDYRTDFYSLGATFYELLLGTPPFAANDAMELIHAHLAKQPEPPHQIQPEIPEMVSQIVLKLLAKNAEDRYQSAYGIRADLQRCLQEWQERGAIAPFPLAQQDASGKFQIPQKLYGREAEVKLLLEGFERVSGDLGRGRRETDRRGSSHSELMLVAGYSGVGKSALVNEIHKPITRRKGYFIAGKYDQFQRNIPYSALIRAFQELIRQALTESPEQVDRWRLQLLNALGNNGQVLIEVIPEVELIVGKQPALPELGPKEAQNRFNFVFQNFIKVFTQSEHPLVIFLDDLQWADSASLKLIQLLMTAPDSQFLYLVGAYRSNEVSPVHPAMVMADEIRRAGVSVNQINLAPLELSTVSQLMGDTLNCTAERVETLAELVLQVTGGNPFFINEFLKSLYEDGQLNFDAQIGSWEWDLHQIRAVDIPDNVVQLMTGKLQKLSPQTQETLKLAACIGNQFDSRTLALVSKKSQAAIANDLRPAVQEGLILSLDESYRFAGIEAHSADLQIDFKFLHDRVQQAAYVLIPESEKQAIHREIGQLLLTQISPEERDERIFDIVNQMNMGIGQTTLRSQKEELATLNLNAGKKAKDSAAFETALRYLLTGIDLLGAEGWQRQYALSLALHEEAAEAAYSNGDFEETNRLVDHILRHANSVLDKVTAYQVRASVYTAQNNLQATVDTILHALKQLGEPIPRNPSRLRVGLELLYTRFWSVGRRSMRELESLPPMTNPYKLASVKLAGIAALASTNFAPLLVAVIALRVVNLIVRYGSSSSSGSQGIAYGVMLRAGLADVDGAYRFGQFSLQMMEQLHDRYYRTLIVIANESCIRHWKEPLRPSLPALIDAYNKGLELGNQEWASLAISVYCIHQFILGESLATVTQSFEQYIAEMKRFGQEVIVYQIQPWHQLALNLQGEATDPSGLIGTAFNEVEMLPVLTTNQLGIPLFYTHVSRTIWLYYLGDYDASLKAARQAKPLEESAPVTPGYALRYFYESLACLGLCTTATKPDRRKYLRIVRGNQRRAKFWAKHCPANYQHRYDLVEAERMRVLGRQAEAMKYYDRAIKGAIAHEYINDAALANELAARFYLKLGLDKVAQSYLLDARYCYLRWGATFKVDQLDTQHPELRDRMADRSRDSQLPQGTVVVSSSSKRGSTSGSLNLDLDTVIEAARTISSEIVLDQLLAKLLALLVENAGAQKGYLLLTDGEELRIEAEAQVDRAEPVRVESRPLTSAQELPISIVNYVQRTREDVVLGNTAVEGMFTSDPYILQAQPQSVLCTPILNQGNLTGILYLENNLATNAFTPDRLAVLNILSAQAAIALENASFYRVLERKVEDRTAQLAQANQEITLLNQRLQSENLRMGAELDVTRQMQMMVLPKEEELSQIPDLEIAGFMEPADEVGGDYYDVMHHKDGIKIGIGDVTGHGLASGVLMLMVQTAVRTLLATQETDSTRFLATLNRVIYSNVQRMDLDRNLTLALLDYERGRLRLSGQHEEILIVRADGTIERMDTIDLGMPIGLIHEIEEFVNHTEVFLNSGDGAVLYTDGVTEAINSQRQQYGLERLCQVIQQNWHSSTHEIREAIIRDLRSHIGDQKLGDDVTLLVIKQR
jgi:predicted ATPase/serine phosphatase RsbU (regulator of sigma subunit)/tRNA A-37 threonylcarbamoyl transferase component Bud32